MGLFLRNHILWLVLQGIQMLTIVGILWLGDFEAWSLLLYALFLSSFFLFLYMFYRYMSQRRLYRLLSGRLKTLDDALQPLDRQVLSQELSRLLREQYQLFQGEMLRLEERQKEHLIFVDRWVHQMKTPLSVLELLAEDLDEPDASSLREELDRLKSGLSMALSMARLRQLIHDFHVEQVNLSELVKDVVREERRLFIRSRVYPQLELGEDLFVYTDRKWCRFVLEQIVENAVKYSKGQGERVSILARRTEEGIRLSVTDQGIGIPKEDQRRIFQSFYTGKNGRLYPESTGVGLFLVREVTRQLDHGLEVESAVGEGTTFTLIFH